jgi:chromosome segregation ATPase
MNIEQAQNKREQTKNSALEVEKFPFYFNKKKFLFKIKQQHDKLKEELEQIELQTKNIDPEALKRVQELIADYEKAKKEENERRTTYKNEKTELEEEIAKLEARVHASPEDNTEENEKMKQIEEQYKLIADRLQKQRLVMVKYLFYS